MADAPAPPPAIAGPDAAAPPPVPVPVLAAVDAQLQELVAQAMERSTAARTHLARRAENAIATMKDALADLLVVAGLARTTAAVVPGLHDVARVLSDLYAQSYVVQTNLEPEWRTAVAVMACANATVVVPNQAGVDAPLIPPTLDEPDRLDPVRLAPSRKRRHDDGDDDGDAGGRSEYGSIFHSDGPLYEDDEDDKDYVLGQDSDDDDVDYDSDSADEDCDSDDASEYSDTSKDEGLGVPACAPMGVPVPAIDAGLLASLVEDEYGKLMCGPAAKFEITQDRRDTVPLQDLDFALGPCSKYQHQHFQLANCGAGRTIRLGCWNDALMARVAVTIEYARFCIACGHAPHSTRTACCDDWSRRPTTVDCGIVVLGVRRRR